MVTAPMDDWSEIFYKGSSAQKLVEAGLKRNIFTKDEIASSSFDLYSPPNPDDLKRVGISRHWMSYYERWTPQWNYYYAAENTGFKANTERTEGTYSKYVGIDDKFERLHFYTTFIKFGIGQASYDASQEIRNKKITREEGISLVRKFDSEFPSKYFKEILEYLEIDEKTFSKTVDSFRSPHLWEKKNNNWILKHQL